MPSRLFHSLTLLGAMAHVPPESTNVPPLGVFVAVGVGVLVPRKVDVGTGVKVNVAVGGTGVQVGVAVGVPV